MNPTYIHHALLSTAKANRAALNLINLFRYVGSSFNRIHVRLRLKSLLNVLECGGTSLLHYGIEAEKYQMVLEKKRVVPRYRRSAVYDRTASWRKFW